MKKLGLSILLCINVVVTTNHAFGQCIKEGTVIVDAYYGFPNLYTTVFKAAYVNNGSPSDVKVTGIGPVGLRGEYLLTNKLGLGLDLGYNSTTVTYKYSNVFNGPTYTETAKTQKIGIMATINYHFIVKEHIDFYGMYGVGYGNRTFTDKSTEPGYTSTVILKSTIPIASRLGIGLRYFFTDKIGANLALGFGQGGLINAGISFKI
jgi:outer membrane protein W